MTKRVLKIYDHALGKDRTATQEDVDRLCDTIKLQARTIAEIRLAIGCHDAQLHYRAHPD